MDRSRSLLRITLFAIIFSLGILELSSLNALSQPRSRRASLERTNYRTTGRRDLVGPYMPIVGVKLPPPWDVRVPTPGDGDFSAAQDKAWEILGTALQRFSTTVGRKGALQPNSVEAFGSVPNVFRIHAFAPSAIPTLRAQSGIMFVSNAPGVVGVRPAQSWREESLIDPAQIGLENPGAVSYIDITGLKLSSRADVDIDVFGAWDRTIGKPDVVVAIIDDEFDLTQPEIASNVYTNTKEIPCNGIDDDGNGFIDDYQGYHSQRRSGCYNPTAGPVQHGTSMALAMAALPKTTTNTITGVAPGVRYLPIATGPLLDSGLNHAYAYVIAMKRAGVPIRVVNLSLSQSTPHPWACSPTDKKGPSLIGELLASAVTVVAAAGNEGSNNDVSFVCPSGLARTSDTMISVGAVDFEGKLPFFSNFGLNSVTVAAPGSAIYTGYGYQTGTSIATALVSGVVALMYSANSEITPAEVKRIVIETAKLSELNLPNQTRGIISAARAVKAVPGRWGPAIKKPKL
jgi:subtilisin family serine protease